MTKGVNRRGALATIGGGIIASLSGCSSTGGSDGSSSSDSESGDSGGSTTGSSDSDASGSVNIRFASGYPAGDDSYPTGLNIIKDKLESKSDGDISVQVYPDSEQGSDQELIQKVQTGSLQMGHASLNNIAPYVQKLNVKNLPLLIPTIEAGDKLLESDTWANIMHSEFRNSEFEPMTSYMFDFRHLGVNAGVAEGGIKAPSDAKGVQIRVAGSEIVANSFSEAGASPTNIAWSEAPSAMKEGVFDAIHISRLAHCSYNFGEIEEYVTNPNIANTIHGMVMNKSFYDGLDQTYQEIIQETYDEHYTEMISMRDAALADAEKCIEDQGATFTELSDSQRQKWIDQVGYTNGMWDESISNFGVTRETVNKIASVAQ
jgi:TRAP-type C4-dicarboxylate transport system substrate-binding protein